MIQYEYTKPDGCKKNENCMFQNMTIFAYLQLYQSYNIRPRKTEGYFTQLLLTNQVRIQLAKVA